MQSETAFYHLLIFEEIPFHFRTMTFFRVTRTQTITFHYGSWNPSSAYFLVFPIEFHINKYKDYKGH